MQDAVCEKLGIVPEEAYAQISGLSLATIRRHRHERIGPQPVIIGQRRYYRISDLVTPANSRDGLRAMGELS